MIIWMKVTNDKYELPLFIADSQKELAEMVGVKPQTIREIFMQIKKGRIKTSTYKKVEIEYDNT